MSNFQDNPSVSTKPIDKVKDCLRDIESLHSSMKVDIAEIKSDLKIILQRIKEKEAQENQILKNQVKKQEDLAKGWFFTY
tara:strand:- start:4075 stop:4314 length:240 start_codon:yes stop_codon:yes gene_type:complete